MASTTKRLLYNSDVFKKFLFTRLIGRSAHVLAGTHSVYCNRCRIGTEVNHCLGNNNFPVNISLILRRLVNKADEEIRASSIEHPGFSQYPKVQSEKILFFLTSNGFSVDDVVEMVSICPDILKKNETELNKTLDNFRKCRFIEDEIVSTLKNCPHHFCADPNSIVNRYRSFRHQFSQKLVVKIFSSCPNIMFVKWKTIQDKLEYLKNVMFVVDRQIAFSSALECPLDVIKVRHTFLVRAGIFETPDPKSSILLKNPSLKEIIDSDDEYFAEKVAGLTTEEYNVFVELFLATSEVSKESDDEFEYEDSE